VRADKHYEVQGDDSLGIGGHLTQAARWSRPPSLRAEYGPASVSVRCARSRQSINGCSCVSSSQSTVLLFPTVASGWIGCSRTRPSMRRHTCGRAESGSFVSTRPIAEAGVSVVGVATLPLGERLPGHAEPAADPGDVSLVGRLP